MTNSPSPAATPIAPELVCVGESMILVTPSDGPLADASAATIGIAGAESNVAAQVAAAGHRVAWASRLGDDPFADRILAELRPRGIELWVERDADAPTGVMFKDPGVIASSVHYYRRGSAASRMRAGFLDGARLAGVRIVHTTGITPALSPDCARMVDRLFADARDVGALVSFDVNDRRALWPLADAAPALARLANAADIAFVGRDEAERLWGTATPAGIRSLIPDAGILVVKDGEVGATAFAGASAPVFVPAPVVDVVEPVGAGDAYASGFLAATLDGLPLADRLAAGHAAAARVLTIPHDLPPLAR
ncbi:2-dehydro-3-deoxygluconokinase [Microbacterium resistens]|uniref:2-dehydro-3-deoxygluconokinase n=1 Tax=Microbacterium resistens TaxID=156977 RepID=A0ABU1S920_9MICO|nr:sugar kinase [Microbacterium resistens]MDR6865773.1 2-dehydro-3-deoxygluconokinase [Microbacterium resistens]